MEFSLDNLKSNHQDWYEILTKADHADVLAYYDLCFAAMSNNGRAQKAIAAAFPGCREAVSDWTAIAAACADLMDGGELDKCALKSEQVLNSVMHGGVAAVKAYDRIVDNRLSRVRTLRVTQGLSQQALANASGVNIRQIQRIEGGGSDINNLTLKNAVAIANALGVTAEDLLK